MEPSVEIELPEGRSEGVGEKRMAVEDGDVLTDCSPLKRIKEGSDRSVVVDVKKVAEMVLVLAAMGKMRGGRGPTETEKELMAEARSSLAKVCQGFAPKDVFPRDAFGGVIEDLGLNKLKEQRLGFRPVKIAEKLLISKRKMEITETFSLRTTPNTSQYLQGNSGASIESRTALHPSRASQLDKSSHMTISSGSVQSSSLLAHGTKVNSSSLQYQLPTSEIRSIGSSSLPSSHLSSEALPRVDKPHLRSDGKSNGSSNTSQVQANYSANTTVRTPTWAVQAQSVTSAKIGSESKVPVNPSLKVEGAADAKSGVVPQARSRTVVAQTTAGPPSQGTSYAQAPPLGSTHTEIGKIVQKLLQPRNSERPTWNPPSRDYMNKALTCQMCMSTITEIDSVLICDGCEKGYHLKCLQSTSQKGVPRGEWHCGKCLSLSNGKSLPPKYGRVMRNASTSKVPSNSPIVQSTLSKKIGASEIGGPLNVTTNGNGSMPNVSTEVEVNSYNHQITGTKREDAKGMQENDVILSRSRTDEKISSGADPNNVMKTSSFVYVISDEKTCDEKMIELKPNPLAKFETVPNSSDKSCVMVNAQDGNVNRANVEASPLKQSVENHLMDSIESIGDAASNHDSDQLKERVAIRDNTSEIAASTGVMNQDRSRLHAVNWIGDPIQILDEKTFYSSCRINGYVYKSMDHVLVRFDNDKLVPSKLQAMWEDNSTTKKWVTINRCYFPGDLPEAVGRPCGLESSEVYESSCGRALMAGLIESPCQVLTPRKFAEETERRTLSGTQLRLPPLYLCKWIYDEAKGLFRDISC